MLGVNQFDDNQNSSHTDNDSDHYFITIVTYTNNIHLLTAINSIDYNIQILQFNLLTKDVQLPNFRISNTTGFCHWRQPEINNNNNNRSTKLQM